MNSFFRGWKEGMGQFGHKIAIIINTVLLFVVYIIGVGITAIIARLFGKRFLKTRLGKKSYWNDLDLKKQDLEEYYRQF